MCWILNVHFLIDFHVQIFFQQIHIKYSIQLFDKKLDFEALLLMKTLFLLEMIFSPEISDYYQEFT